MRLFQLVTFHNNAEADMAVRKWLRMEESDLYRDNVFKLLPSWNKFIDVL
jgi:hypothetical protein